MSDKLKTIPDIIAKMRKQDCAGGWCDYLEDFADLLEAAYKRELGNMQKMREALEAVRDAHFVREENGEECEGFYVEADDGTGRPLICVVEDALAACRDNGGRQNILKGTYQ